MRLPDCQGGSFTSPPCGEDLCRSCGPGEETLRRQHEDEQDARDRMEQKTIVVPGKCPITLAELTDPWTYQNSHGWFWRVDWAGAGPFASEALALADVCALISWHLRQT